MKEENCNDFNEELKEAGWNVLHDHPGTGMTEWIEYLFEEYPTEVIDALGTNQSEVYAELQSWWNECEYNDGVQPTPFTFNQWAERFATGGAVLRYDALAEAKEKQKNSECSNRVP